ncbi:MAG: ATP-dependent metallopeptidase FtsH/Yme1/Tma family protein [Bryobacterales bacterium]
MNSTVKTAVFWVVMLCTAILLWQVVRTGRGPDEEQLSFSAFQSKVAAGDVAAVTITNGVEIAGKYKNSDKKFTTVIPSDYPAIIDKLDEQGVEINVQPTASPAWLSFLINASPFILLFGFWIFMMRQMQAGGNKALSFGKSRARLLTSQQKK